MRLTVLNRWHLLTSRIPRSSSDSPTPPSLCPVATSASTICDGSYRIRIARWSTAHKWAGAGCNSRRVTVELAHWTVEFSRKGALGVGSWLGGLGLMPGWVSTLSAFVQVCH